MNKVYFFSSNDAGGIYVADKDFKSAKAIAINNKLIAEHSDNPFIDTRGHLCRDYNKKPIKTELKGDLSIQQIIDIGFAWWDCKECNNDDFEVIDHESSYKCRACGYVDNIPYVG